MGSVKFLYNSKFDFTVKSLITNTVVITRVLCTLYVGRTCGATSFAERQ